MDKSFINFQPKTLETPFTRGGGRDPKRATHCNTLRHTLTRDSQHPIPQWAALEGCTTAVLMTEYDDAKKASGQCARACGALTRVHRACLWRAQRVCATPLPLGGARARSSARGQRDVAVCLTSSAASAFVVAGFTVFGLLSFSPP